MAYDDLRLGLSAIERVHGVHDLPPVPVRLVADQVQRGRFSYDRATGLPISITINRLYSERAWTLVHEVGHVLDLCALGRAAEFGSSTNSLTEAWNLAVNHSLAYKHLLRMWERGTTTIITHEDERQIVSLSPEEYDTVETLLLPEEVFARSYVQYIAAASGVNELRDSLDAFRQQPRGRV